MVHVRGASRGSSTMTATVQKGEDCLPLSTSERFGGAEGMGLRCPPDLSLEISLLHAAFTRPLERLWHSATGTPACQSDRLLPSNWPPVRHPLPGGRLCLLSPLQSLIFVSHARPSPSTVNSPTRTSGPIVPEPNFYWRRLL
jgi:hypothetical protein